MEKELINLPTFKLSIDSTIQISSLNLNSANEHNATNEINDKNEASDKPNLTEIRPKDALAVTNSNNSNNSNNSKLYPKITINNISLEQPSDSSVNSYHEKNANEDYYAAENTSNEVEFTSNENLKSRESLKSVTKNSCTVFTEENDKVTNLKSRVNNLLRMRMKNLSISTPNLVKAFRGEGKTTRKSCYFYLKNSAGENGKKVKKRRCISSSSIPNGVNAINDKEAVDSSDKNNIKGEVNLNLKSKSQYDTHSLKSSDSNSSTISNLLPSPSAWPQYGSVKRKAFCLATADTIDQAKVDKDANEKEAISAEQQSKPGIEVLTLISVWIRNSPKDFYGKIN